MTEQNTISTNSLTTRFVPLVSQDAQLLAILRDLAEEFLRLTAAPLSTPQASDHAATTDLPEPVAVQDDVSPSHVPLASCPGIEVPIAWFRRLAAADSDLALIEARCRLKGEGARWAATRQRIVGEGASFATEIEPKDREIVEKASTLEDCFLWMNHSTAPIPTDLRLWDDVAGCFDAEAMAVAVLRRAIERVEVSRGFLEKAIHLAAEAQSALRMAVQMVDGKPDKDQLALFNWLRQMAMEEQVYIPRFMRIDAPADPTQWKDLQKRITELGREVDAVWQRERQRIKALKKGQYHARIIREGKGTEADWKKVIEVVDTLVGQGTPASNVDFREMLVPIIDEIPEGEVPAGFQRVLVEVDRYLAMKSSSAKEAVDHEASDDVRMVADLYKGKTMVVIGGDRRPHACEALQSAFCLKELIWIATRDHESTDKLFRSISRPDVDVVLLAIRWSSHSYGNVKVICDRLGKEFYRLPAGYNPNRVAHQILQHRGC